MELIQRYISQLQTTLDFLPLHSIDAVIRLLHKARLERKHIFIMGNGGSASTASHFVCDLAKNTRTAGLPHFRVLEMTDNTALLSAYANDEGYENVFANHLANFVQPGDVVIAISTSGNSPNVLRAVELGNRVQAHTVGFTGFDGGQLRTLAAMNVHVASDCIEQVEDIHLMLGHLITTNLRQLAAQMERPDTAGSAWPLAEPFPTALQNSPQPR